MAAVILPIQQAEFGIPITLDDQPDLRHQADGIAENWGAGGTYRQITTALVGAAAVMVAANAAYLDGFFICVSGL